MLGGSGEEAGSLGETEGSWHYLDDLYQSGACYQNDYAEDCKIMYERERE